MIPSNIFPGVALTFALLLIVLFPAIVGCLSLAREKRLQELYRSHGFSYDYCRDHDAYPYNCYGVKLGDFFIYKSNALFNRWLAYLFFLCPASDDHGCILALWVSLGDNLIGVWLYNPFTSVHSPIFEFRVEGSP